MNKWHLYKFRDDENYALSIGPLDLCVYKEQLKETWSGSISVMGEGYSGTEPRTLGQIPNGYSSPKRARRDLLNETFKVIRKMEEDLKKHMELEI